MEITGGTDLGRRLVVQVGNVDFGISVRHPNGEPLTQISIL